MKNFRKRWTAWVLMFSLIISAVPVNAFAYDGGVADDQVIEIAQGGFYDLTQDLEAGLEGVWESDNEEIVVVNENGVAEGKAVGETTVRFTAEKINLGPAPEMKDEAVNVPANSDAAAPGPDAGVIAPGEEDSQLNQEPGSIDTPVVDENNSEKTDSELTGTEGTGSEVNGGEEGNTTDTPATDETGSNNEAVENDGANGGEPAVGDEGTDEGGISDEGNGTDESNTSDEGGSEAAGSDEGDTSNEPSAEGTDGAYLTEETDDTVVYTWTVRVYDPAVVAETCKQLEADLNAFGEKFGPWQEEYFAGLTEDSLDEYGDLTVEAKTAFGEAAVAQFGEELNALIALYQQIPASVRNDVDSEFNATFATLVNIAEQLGLDLDKAIQTLDINNGTLTQQELNGKTVTLTKDVTVISTINLDIDTTLNLNGHNVTFKGNEGSVFVVKSGTFTITGNGTIDGKKKGSVITVNGGELVMNSGTIKNGIGTSISEDAEGESTTSNNGYKAILNYDNDKSDEKVTCGGGVLVRNKGKFTMNGGTIMNNTAEMGGGICAFRATVVKIYGGTIKDNTATLHSGGGIFIAGRSNKNIINPTEGSITISGNKTGTTCDLGGGGIFLDSAGQLKIVNAIITGNKANGLGGGVSGCLHGMVTNLAPDTTAIYSNKSKVDEKGNASNTHPQLKNRVDMGYKGISWTYSDPIAKNADDYFCAGYSTISPLALGKDNIAQWYGYKMLVKKDDANASKENGYVATYAAGNNVTQANPIIVLGLLGMKVQNGDVVGAKAMALNGNKVFIQNNYSAMHGGGVATNGILKFGQSDFDFSNNTISIHASKAINGALKDINGSVTDGSKAGYTFRLYNSKDVFLGEAVTNINGVATFSNLNTLNIVGKDKKPDTNNEVKDTLKLVEVAGDKAGMTYDTTEHKIEITFKRTFESETVYTDYKDNGKTPQGNSITHTVYTDTITTVKYDNKALSNATDSKEFTGKTIYLNRMAKRVPAAAITNTMEYGSLNVTKTVPNESPNVKDKAFEFTVTFDAGTKTANWNAIAVTGATESSRTNGTVTFKLKAGDTATITGIPAGVTYTVEEKLGADASNYTVEYNGVTVEKASGNIIANGTAEVTVTNTREVGGLTVTKALNWDKTSVPPDSKSYTVKVNIGNVPDIPENQKEPVSTDVDFSVEGNKEGIYLLTFDFAVDPTNTDGYSASNAISITNIPVGTEYKVSEVDPGTGYDVTYVKGYDGDAVNTVDNKSVSVTGKIVNGENNQIVNTATITNHYFKTSETTIPFEKKWSGISENDKVLYPDSVTVQLVRTWRNGSVIDEEVVEGYENVVLTADEQWQTEFKDLPEYRAEKVPYTYSVKEIDVKYNDNAKALIDHLYKDSYHGKKFAKVEIQGSLCLILGDKTGNGIQEVLGAFSILPDSGNQNLTNKWISADDLGDNYFKVVKVDNEKKDVKLAGAVFKLYNSDGEEVRSATTDEFGVAEFNKLPEGEYKLVETEAPTGYLKGDTFEWQINISKALTKVERITTDETEKYTNTWKWDITGSGIDVSQDGDNYLGTLTVGNTQIKGNIQFTKKVTLDGISNDETNRVAKQNGQKFNFTVYYFAGGVKGAVVANFGVEAGETQTANLPYGDYLIVEDESNTAIENYNFGGVSFAGATAVTEDGQVIGYKVSVTEQGQTYEVTATNQYNRYTGDLSITKTVTGDKGELDKLWDFTITLKAPANADHVKLADTYTVKVTGNDAAEATQTLTLTPVADGEGAVSGKIQLAHGQTATISGLPVGTGYEVVEDRANYDDYTTTAVDENGVIATEGAKVFFVNDRSEEKIPATKSLTVYKEWALDQSEDRPESISVQLLKDGEPEGEPVVLNIANRWQYTWDNLNTKDHSWSVREVEVPEGYQVTVSDVDVTPTGNEITIINTLLKPGDLLVNKVWVGDTAADRPEFITVQLYNGSTLYDTVEVRPDASGNWNYKWSDLPEGEWRVEEADTPANYSVEYTGPVNQVATITNTYHQPLTVNKVWVGGNETNRPAAITVQLYNGTTPYGDAVQLTAEGGWTHTWIMLPLDGNWRVVETTVPDGYHANVSGVVNGVIVVTNTYDDNNGGGDEPGGDEPETNIPNEPTPLTDLPDDDVPLATLPSADGEGENDDEEIFDEEIPLADVPTTGDDGKSGLWLALAMSSGLAGIWLHQNGRKRREETQD